MGVSSNVSTWVVPAIYHDKPNVARIYDYFLGGNHNFPADREVATRIIAANPDIPLVARANRAFLHRVVRTLVGMGIDQFLDIGSGIPTVGNVHEIVLRANPLAHTVYVDNDPIAIIHSEDILMLDRCTHAATAIEGDAQEIEGILAHPEVLRMLDFSRPIAVLMLALLHFISDNTIVAHIIQTLRETLPAGSYVAISHGTREHLAPETADQLVSFYQFLDRPPVSRTAAQIRDLCGELEILEPGIVYLPLWRPDHPDDLLLDRPERSIMVGGVARTPYSEAQSD